MSEPRLPDIISADYLAEVRVQASLPALGPAEIAISGRSNVGKSTLLNRLAGRKALARTSKTPGRTRGIIFYDLEARWPDQTERRALRLVDLPGYGYAQVARTERKSWGPLIEGYVEARPTLKLFFVLVDARRGIEEDERQLCEWLGGLGVPYQIVVTKVDKLSATERGLVKARCRAAVAPSLPVVTLVSAVNGEGIPGLWAAVLRAVSAAD